MPVHIISQYKIVSRQFRHDIYTADDSFVIFCSDFFRFSLFSCISYLPLLSVYSSYFSPFRFLFPRTHTGFLVRTPSPNAPAWSCPLSPSRTNTGTNSWADIHTHTHTHTQIPQNTNVCVKCLLVFLLLTLLVSFKVTFNLILSVIFNYRLPSKCRSA